MVAYRAEYADVSKLMGVCNRKGKEKVIICFVACSHTTYLYENGIMLTGAWEWKHVDVNMQMGACRWEYANGSMETGVW